jgi:hypothetical protein
MCVDTIESTPISNTFGDRTADLGFLLLRALLGLIA